MPTVSSESIFEVESELLGGHLKRFWNHFYCRLWTSFVDCFYSCLLPGLTDVKNMIAFKFETFFIKTGQSISSSLLIVNTQCISVCMDLKRNSSVFQRFLTFLFFNDLIQVMAWITFSHSSHQLLYWLIK